MWAMAENYAPRRFLNKQKKNEQQPNATEFEVEEVASISNFFNTSVHGEAIKHLDDDADQSKISDSKDNLRALKNAPQEEFVTSDNQVAIPDSSGHVHNFEPIFIDNSEFDLFDLETLSKFHHQIRINVGHPFIRKLQWGNPDVREAVIQLIYLMSIPEVFLPLRNDKAAYKKKINEIVDSTLSRLVQRKES